MKKYEIPDLSVRDYIFNENIAGITASVTGNVWDEDYDEMDD